MEFNFHTNHKLLLLAIGLGFTVLSLSIAVIPAYTVQENNPPIAGKAIQTDAELRGKMIYVSEGCQGCHTQQVRSNIIDKMWGKRPSIPADYARNERMSFFRNTASLLGSERTGPDLTNIGERQPGEIWHYLHLYNPRSVVTESIMPAYPWLFDEVKVLKPGDDEVSIPDDFIPQSGQHVITTEKVRDLVAYLKSLKQAPIPAYLQVKFNAFEWQETVEKGQDEALKKSIPNGAKLYAANCKVCHQKNGKGITGAFPSLDQSKIVNNDDPTEMIQIVLFGLDRKNEYGAMIPFEEKLTDEEIAAIISFERGEWGNSASKVSAQQVKEVRAAKKSLNGPL